MDGVTLFAGGLIAGGLAILAIAIVTVARRHRLPASRADVSTRYGRGSARVRSPGTGSRADFGEPRPAPVFRSDPMARRGGDRPDRRDRYDPRDGHDEYRDRDQRRVVRRDEAGYDSPRRPDTRGGRPNPPPIRPSALVADTVLLQPVPAWSTPARPRNDGPPVRPTAPDALPNAAPRGVEKSMPPEPSANASRRHDDRPEGRLYGGR